jgi:hypothetical protein
MVNAQNGDFRRIVSGSRGGLGIRGQSLENHRWLEHFRSAAPGAYGSNNLEQQQNDDDQKDQAHAAATVVTDSRAQTIATKSENEKQNNKNDQHTFSFAELLRVTQQQL